MRGGEAALQQVIVPVVAVVADSGADAAAAADALEAEDAHQPGDGTAGHRYAF
jgi:hypothetical protein